MNACRPPAWAGGGVGRSSSARRGDFRHSAFTLRTPDHLAMAPRIPSGDFAGDAGLPSCRRLAAALKVGHVPRPVLVPAGILAKASRGVRTVVLSGTDAGGLAAGAAPHPHLWPSPVTPLGWAGMRRSMRPVRARGTGFLLCPVGGAGRRWRVWPRRWARRVGKAAEPRGHASFCPPYVCHPQA